MDFTLPALVAAGVLAGFIDSIIGGGGIISLPALLATGMPPHVALATNKVVGTGASSIASFNYWRAGLLNNRIVLLLGPLAAGASAIGAAAILRIDGQYILWAVVSLMVILSAYILARPKFGSRDRTEINRGVVFTLLAGAMAIGLYDGLLGPGAGNLLLFLFVAVAGMPFLRAAAHGRVINFGSNIGALAFFATTGLIDWKIGPIMAIGTITGGWLGSQSNIRQEAKWVRGLFVSVTALLLVRLLLA